MKFLRNSLFNFRKSFSKFIYSILTIFRSILTAAHCICPVKAKQSSSHLPGDELACVPNRQIGPITQIPENQIVTQGNFRDNERDVYYFVGEKSIPPWLYGLIQQHTFIPKTSLQLPKATKAYVLKTKRKGNEVLIDLTIDIGLVISTDVIINWEGRWWGNNIDEIRLPTFTGRYVSDI